MHANYTIWFHFYFLFCVTLPSVSCLSFHTSTYGGPHLSLAQTKQNKTAIFKNPSATIHSKAVQRTHLGLLGDKLCIHLSPYQQKYLARRVKGVTYLSTVRTTVSSLQELGLLTCSYFCETLSSSAAGKYKCQLDRSSITLLKMFFHYPDLESKYLVVSDTA